MCKAITQVKGDTMKAPLLELKNIGKIYVSENNVAVGIRGVNASFESPPS